MNENDAENFLSKFGENFEVMIENVSDVVSEPMWNPENNSTYDDFLTYKVFNEYAKLCLAHATCITTLQTTLTQGTLIFNKYDLKIDPRLRLIFNQGNRRMAASFSR